MSLLPALARKNGQSCPFLVLDTSVERKMSPVFAKQLLPSEWTKHCCVVVILVQYRGPLQRNIPLK